MHVRGYVCLMLLSVASPALAQRAPRDSVPQQDTLTSSPSVPRRAWPECQPGIDIVRSELLALDRHAGPGVLLGIVAGLVYGAATTSGPARGAVMMYSGFVGASAGFALGSAVYLFRRATGYQPPIRPRCVP